MELWEPWKRSHKAEDEQEFARYRGEGVTKLSPMDEAGSCSVWVQWPITKPELRSTQHKPYSVAKDWGSENQVHRTNFSSTSSSKGDLTLNTKGGGERLMMGRYTKWSTGVGLFLGSGLSLFFHPFWVL